MRGREERAWEKETLKVKGRERVRLFSGFVLVLVLLLFEFFGFLNFLTFLGFYFYFSFFPFFFSFS